MNKLILNDQKKNALISKICRDIALSGWRPNYIVGLTRGGLIPAVMISHYLNVPMHTLNISLRDGNVGPESNLWMAEDAFGNPNNTVDFMLEDPTKLFEEDTTKQILIVDDINDTGATFNWIMEDWPSGCFPDDPVWENDVWNNNVKFAVLVDNLSSNCKVKMDFVGMEINKAENDVWVDFPWEDWWAK
jgi:hypoxanthine phosphoribosyltransferase